MSLWNFIRELKNNLRDGLDFLEEIKKLFQKAVKSYKNSLKNPRKIQ